MNRASSERARSGCRAAALVLLLSVCLSCGQDGGSNPVTPPTPAPTPREQTGITIVSPRSDLRVGEVLPLLRAYGQYDDGTTGTVVAAWTSSDPTVAEVSGDGIVTGMGVGPVEVTASLDGFSASVTFAVELPEERSPLDRPDDHDGPQVHVIYAVASDVEDGNLDRYGNIARSMEAIQNWIGAELGYRLLLDTYEGELDVTFLRLPFPSGESAPGASPTEPPQPEGDDPGDPPAGESAGQADDPGAPGVQDPEPESRDPGESGAQDPEPESEDPGASRVQDPEPEGGDPGVWLVDELERVIGETIGIQDHKVYAVYYVGRSDGLCGSAQVLGRVAAVYVGDACSGSLPGADPEVASTYEAVMLHELFHVFGAAAVCDPQEGAGPHVRDDPLDLMASGPERGPRDEVVIDVARDDYFGHGRADCPDIAESRFWERIPADFAPAELDRYPLVDVPAADRPLRCELRQRSSEGPLQVRSKVRNPVNR